MVALAIPLYARIERAERPNLKLLGLNTLVHAAIVHTHLFGLFYSGAFAAAFFASRLFENGLDLRASLRRYQFIYRFSRHGYRSFFTFLPILFRPKPGSLTVGSRNQRLQIW